MRYLLLQFLVGLWLSHLIYGEELEQQQSFAPLNIGLQKQPLTSAQRSWQYAMYLHNHLPSLATIELRQSMGVMLLMENGVQIPVYKGAAIRVGARQWVYVEEQALQSMYGTGDPHWQRMGGYVAFSSYQWDLAGIRTVNQAKRKQDVRFAISFIQFFE